MHRLLITLTLSGVILIAGAMVPDRPGAAHFGTPVPADSDTRA